MEWINEKAKTLKQGAIRAMFDRANTMTGVISLGIGEPDMPTPKLVCEACKEADRKSTRLNSSHTDSSRMPSSA